MDNNLETTLFALERITQSVCSKVALYNISHPSSDRFKSGTLTPPREKVPLHRSSVPKLIHVTLSITLSITHNNYNTNAIGDTKKTNHLLQYFYEEKPLIKSR